MTARLKGPAVTHPRPSHRARPLGPAVAACYRALLATFQGDDRIWDALPSEAAAW
jgi:hypothetical protein